MVGFIFGGDTGETPESIKRKREIAMALLGQNRAPRTIGEGINALGDGIVANVMNRRANAGEKAGRQSADQAFGGIDFSSLFGGGGAAYPSAVAGGASPTSGTATGTTPTTGATVDLSGDKQKFIDTLLPAAIEHGQRIGVDPRIIVAQAAQETGWGKSAPGNNFFGIKSHGQGGGQNLTTHEVINGQRVKINDSFRTFASPQDSVAGYADFIASNKRYRPMREAQGLDAQLQALGASGYATDPNYSRSVGAIARSINLPQQPQGTQVASLDPSIGMSPAVQSDFTPIPAQPMPDTTNGAAIDPRQALQPMAKQPEAAPAVAPYDFTGNPQLSAGAGMPFQGGQPQQMASVNPQQQADPKAAIRDALLRQNDMMLGGALAPQRQAPQQVADASGAFPPAPTGQPFAGQQGGDARGAMVQKLMQAAQNPWLNDNQRAMVNALLQKQMEQGDPMRQLQMQKLQQDIARGGQTSDWSKLDDNRLFNQRTGEIRDLPTNPNAPSGDLGLNPQYGLDKDGNPVLLQLGKNGKVVQSQMPEGVTLSKEPIKLDAGTHFVLLDPITRQPVGQIPKDVAGAASEGAAGKAQGEAAANIPVVEANANSILGMIDSLDTDPYLDSMVGPVASRMPNITADAARVQSKMDQIGGQAFLQAFNSLKGGGQITEIEGQKATQAIARLNTAQSPADYRQALGELRQIVLTGVQRARQQAGGGAASQTAPAIQPQTTAPANNGGFRIIGVE
ncbi:glycoside hydrolase family 73 protein [Brucella intermedia]|uniref:glycoside hydrolase family 73 protein n=1 Tax=Brucella intermedia TaxID=94625 RepID=UPI0031F2FDE0